MWTCLNCNTENNDTDAVCIKCKLGKNYTDMRTAQLKKKPLSIIICNVLFSLFCLTLIIFGIFVPYQISITYFIFYWLLTLAYIVSVIGLWKFKKWGLFLCLGSYILIVAFLSGPLSINVKPSYAFFICAFFYYQYYDRFK